jgi:hypothetical protein
LRLGCGGQRQKRTKFMVDRKKQRIAKDIFFGGR